MLRLKNKRLTKIRWQTIKLELLEGCYKGIYNDLILGATGGAGKSPFTSIILIM
jgi:hypothetical protein